MKIALKECAYLLAKRELFEYDATVSAIPETEKLG